MVTIYSTPKHADEPESIRVKGHRIHTGQSHILSHIDVYQYADGTVRAISTRRREHVTGTGALHSLADFRRMSYAECVTLHVGNETRIGAYTGEQELTA